MRCHVVSVSDLLQANSQGSCIGCTSLESSLPLSCAWLEWRAGLARSTLENHPKLSKFFKVTAMAADRDGEQYVANMEARSYPITATQWHPVRPISFIFVVASWPQTGVPQRRGSSLVEAHQHPITATQWHPVALPHVLLWI